MMRSGSKPACWKNRLSSAEMTALHQHLGDVVESHQAALLAVAVEQVGDQLRLEQVLVRLGVVAVGDDARDDAVLEMKMTPGSCGVSVHAGKDLHAVGADVVPAHAVAARFVVAAAPECGDEFLGGEGIADADGLRRGVDLGGFGERPGPQFLVDEARVVDPEVGEAAEHQDEDEGDYRYGEEDLPDGGCVKKRTKKAERGTWARTNDSLSTLIVACEGYRRTLSNLSSSFHISRLRATRRGLCPELCDLRDVAACRGR